MQCGNTDGDGTAYQCGTGYVPLRPMTAQPTIWCEDGTCDDTTCCQSEKLHRENHFLLGPTIPCGPLIHGICPQPFPPHLGSLRPLPLPQKVFYALLNKNDIEYRVFAHFAPGKSRGGRFQDSKKKNTFRFFICFKKAYCSLAGVMSLGV